MIARIGPVQAATGTAMTLILIPQGGGGGNGGGGDGGRGYGGGGAIHTTLILRTVIIRKREQVWRAIIRMNVEQIVQETIAATFVYGLTVAVIDVVHTDKAQMVITVDGRED